MRFTYDVFNGVVYIVNPISVCLTLNRKQLLKSFPRKVEIVLFDSQRILKTKNPSFYMPFVLTKISNFLPLIPPLRSPFPPQCKRHTRTYKTRQTYTVFSLSGQSASLLVLISYPYKRVLPLFFILLVFFFFWQKSSQLI